MRLYRAAVDAGSDALAAPLADALALAGDCAGAVALADTLLGSEDPARRAAAVRIAASVATHDGNSGHAAELFGWLGPRPASSPRPRRVVLTATGDAAAPREALDTPHTGPPTSAARAARSLAEGLLLTLDQPYPVAMARLGQAIAAATGRRRPCRTAPPPLVALAALHAGDPVRARSVIGRAVARRQPDAMFGHRHRLLQAWIKMQDGQLQAAAADADRVSDSALHRRDALWSTALRTAWRGATATPAPCTALVRGDGGARGVFGRSVLACCRWANCGWPRPGCGRKTGSRTRWTRRSPC